MKIILYKILSILFIPIFLFVIRSFIGIKHICMDVVYSIFIFGVSEECYMRIEFCDMNILKYCSISVENASMSDYKEILTETQRLEVVNYMRKYNINNLTNK